MCVVKSITSLLVHHLSRDGERDTIKVGEREAHL
jgi:hypothetical protein